MSGLGLGVQALRLAPREQAQRFAAAVIASVIAVTFILPIGGMHHSPHSSQTYVEVALVPAGAAWFIAWGSPGSQRLATFRTVMLAITLVGVGGLALRLVSDQISPWMMETVHSRQFVPQALAYIGVGLIGVIGSLLVSANSD